MLWCGTKASCSMICTSPISYSPGRYARNETVAELFDFGAPEHVDWKDGHNRGVRAQQYRNVTQQ